MKESREISISARAKATQLESILDSVERLLVAYSGGVDSTFLLAEATRVLGEGALGVLADSPSLPRSALKRAIEVAGEFGARVEVLGTTELNDPNYASNPLNRCYFCKFELFTRMQDLARRRGLSVLAYGENAEDALEVRPGSAAAREFQVRAPLREAGLTKAEIRFLSREQGLPTADIPSQPCLSSRIPHGTPVTLGALAMIEQAEEFVRACGFRVFRVRYLASPNRLPVAKLQIAPAEMSRLPSVKEMLSGAFRAIGFTELLVDPEGYLPPLQRVPGAS